jgi:hypothetical protein
MSIQADFRRRRLRPQTSGKAIASLVCGLLSFCIPCLPALPALLLGILGLMDINRSQGRLSGKGMAITGIVTSLVGSLLLAVVATVAVVGIQRGGIPGLAMPSLFEGSQRMRSQNNLKEIGIALHNYHDANQRFPPPAITDKQGRPLLSWRVALLPYLGHDLLYRQFHLDEPWDSPHNKALLASIPKVYACPKSGAVSEPSMTYYHVFVGQRGVVPRPMFAEGDGGIGIAHVVDGMTNTLMVVEAGDPVPWTKPDDLTYTPNGPLPRLVGPYRGGFFTTVGDGSVRWVRAEVPETALRDWITCDDGHITEDIFGRD